jgi:hypothetical protein
MVMKLMDQGLFHLGLCVLLALAQLAIAECTPPHHIMAVASGGAIGDLAVED